MLSKRDKLLIRPWQQRRYDNHRRKVQSALSAIDNTPPPIRNHISVKLKKRQQETERIAKIERDNFILLRKLGHIMKTNRVDNCWSTPPPSFLNRVNMYQHHPVKEVIRKELIPAERTNHIRKSKCSACTPKVRSPPKVPEDRVPWAPEKPILSRKRSQSVPAKRLSLPTVGEKEEEKMNARSKSCKANQRYRASKDDDIRSSRSFVLMRGNLTLAVNFPPDTSVKIRDGISERLLFGGDCYCASMKKLS